jgi:hypothetical protein
MSFHAWNQQLNFIVFCVLIKSRISFIHRTFIGEKKGVKMSANFFTYMFTNPAAETKQKPLLRYDNIPLGPLAAIGDESAAAGRVETTAASQTDKVKMMLIITANIIVASICIISFVAIIVFAILKITIPTALTSTLTATLGYYGGAISSYFNANQKSTN